MKSSVYTARVLGCTVTLNFLFFIALIVLILLNKNNQQYLENDEKPGNGHSKELSEELRDSFCIPCDYFGEGVKENDTLYHHFLKIKNQRYCCIEKHQYIQKMIEKISLDSLPDKPVVKAEDQNITDSFGWWRQRQNSAHLYLNTSSLKDGALQWVTSDEFGTAYMNGVSLSGSKLRVENQGYYFIYTTVSFNFENEEKVPSFYQTVTKEHPILPQIRPQIILMNKYGGSSDLNKHYTSFLCGTFYFQSGFQINTVVSDKRFISSSPHASYFGIYRL